MLKLLNIFKSYLIMLFVLLLIFFQLNLLSLSFSLQSLLFFNDAVSGFILQQPELFFVGGFMACCLLWYSFRPITFLYLVLKNIFNPAYKNSKNNTFKLSNNYHWITRLSNRISKRINITAPHIMIDSSTKVNAKVLPGLFHAPLLVLTQGLLDKLTPDEVEAVVAHELAHIAMHDTYSMSVTDLIIFLTIWLPVYLFHIIIDYVFLYKWRDNNIGFILSLTIVLFAYGFLALLFLNTLNRKYELRADKVAMTYINMQSFLNALHRVHAAESTIPGAFERVVDSMPSRVQKFIFQLFLSHPPIPARIRALQ